MRVIEKSMVDALRAGKAWQSGNTRVTAREAQPGSYLSRVYLHGHEIARLCWRAPCGGGVESLYVTLAGYNTHTTRNRLSAIIDAFVRVGRWPNGSGVSTRSGCARLHDAHGMRAIDNAEWVEVQLSGG